MMGNENWTAGPWLVEDDPDMDESTLATVAWCGAYRIGIETGVKGGNYRDGLHGDEVADALLIAAAPDLSESATYNEQALFPWLSAALEDPKSCDEFKSAIREAMRLNFDALAKSRGESK